MSLLDKLDLIETRLQLLIEGSAARLFPDYNLVNDLAPKLVDALKAGSKQNSNGDFIAPNLFTIMVHPERASLFAQQEAFFGGLTQILLDAGDEAGLHLISPPLIQVAVDKNISLNQFQILAVIKQDNIARTTDTLVDFDNDSENLPSNAFLIVNGTNIIPLTRSVINIGRRSDNQICIDDPRVSRLHAQLRAIKGRFIIFDLDSTGGSFVNGQQIRQCALYPGDVISLSGYPMVYSQDAPGTGETQQYSPPGEN